MCPHECYFNMFLDEELSGCIYQFLTYALASVLSFNVEFGYFALLIYSSVYYGAPAKARNLAVFFRDKDEVLSLDSLTYRYAAALG